MEPSGLVLWSLIAFGAGSLPLAVWLTRVISGADARAFGDGNPGTANAFKAGGWRVGVPALILEVGKAAVPVGAARLVLGMSGWALVPVAVAPIAGHAFSPFLGFRGGKAIAPTFGSWLGLTGFLGPGALGLGMGLCFALQVVDAWTVVGGMLVFGIFLLAIGAPLALLAVWTINLVIVVFKHRSQLSLSFRPRGWLRLPSGRSR